MISKAKILVTGACGQIGTELVAALREKHGWKNVIASDVHPATDELRASGIYRKLDVLNKKKLAYMATHLGIGEIYHLAAVLSAKGEQNPAAAWDLNMQGLLNVLEVAREQQIKKVFWPSSIAVFGPDSMPAVCFQNSKCDPLTVYGMSKMAGEYWVRYYKRNYGLDVRSLRYPGLISHSAPAGGGTTDYAVDIFHAALASGTYTCFLKAHTALPMMFMADAIRATLLLMEAPKANLSVETSYNISAMNFTPAELAAEIKKHLALTVDYAPDSRQQIADSWPQSVNGRHAHEDWGWQPQYGLGEMVSEMLEHMQTKEAGRPVIF
jgi:nucleoside-diphosphate-sugar epimerase